MISESLASAWVLTIPLPINIRHEGLLSTLVSTAMWILILALCRSSSLKKKKSHLLCVLPSMTAFPHSAVPQFWATFKAPCEYPFSCNLCILFLFLNCLSCTPSLLMRSGQGSFPYGFLSPPQAGRRRRPICSQDCCCFFRAQFSLPLDSMTSHQTCSKLGVSKLLSGSARTHIFRAPWAIHGLYHILFVLLDEVITPVRTWGSDPCSPTLGCYRTRPTAALLFPPRQALLARKPALVCKCFRSHGPWLTWKAGALDWTGQLDGGTCLISL